MLDEATGRSSQTRRSIAYTAFVRRIFKAAAGLLLVIVAVSLVLLVLIPHDVQHHSLGVVLFVLVPIFLFGLIVLREVSIFWFSAIYSPLDPANSRPMLFQLPPPQNS